MNDCKEIQNMSVLQRFLCWGCFLASGVVLAFGQLQWLDHRLREGLPWMLVGISLVTTGALLGPRRFKLAPRAGQPRLGAAEIGFVAALTLAGGAVRLIGLDHAPPGGFFDEVQNALVAEDILKGNRPVFIAGATQLPAFFFYVLAAAIAVAGKSVATVRGLAALFGTLTLPAFFFLARRAFSRPVAVASAILFAGSRWHITFSRFGFVTSMGPLLEVLAVLLLWRAAERGKRLDYILLGLVVGIGLQTYYSYNLFPAVLVVAALAYAGRKGRRFWPELLRIGKGLLWSVLVAGVLLFPLVRFAVRNPQVFFQRSNTVAIWNPAHHLPWPGALWQNIEAHLLMFNFRGDGNPRHNIPEAPLLNPIEGVLLAIGLGFAIARIFRWPQLVWLTWFAVMLSPAILTIEAPQAHRAVGVIPAVYLLLGEGFQGIYSLAKGGGRRLRTAVGVALMLVVSVAAASRDVWLYFRVQVRHPLAWPAFQADYHAMARYVKRFGGSRDIWISPLYYEGPIFKFHLGDGFPYQRFRLSEHLPMAAARVSARSAGNLYVLEPFQKNLFPLFQSVYSHAQLEEHPDPFGRLMFISIFVPRSDLEHPSDSEAEQRGFLGVYYQNEKWDVAPVIVRREPTVLFHFHWDQEALPGSFTADWVAKLQIERSGPYTFELVTSGPSLLLVDDHILVATNQLDQELRKNGTISLSRGEHRLVVRHHKKGSLATIYLTWQPPGGSPEVIPMRLLRPLSREEYFGLRDRLPRPETQ